MGLEHVQAYEEQQRQEIAAETVEAVMHPEIVAPVETAQESAASEAPLETKPA